MENRLGFFAKKVLKRLGKPGASVEIFLLAAKDLGGLKRRFGLEKYGQIPDVLAFREPKNFPHPDRRGKFLGEIYLNKELDLGRLFFLLVHGILHLLGYTHDKKRDSLKMERTEKRLIKISQKI